MSKSRPTASKRKESSVSVKIPIALLTSCVAMQPGKEYEMSGLLDNGGSKKKVTIYGNITGSDVSFSMKEEAKGKLQQLLSGIWNCEIISGISHKVLPSGDKKTNKEVTTVRNDNLENIAAGTSTLKRKRGRPPKLDRRKSGTITSKTPKIEVAEMPQKITTPKTTGKKVTELPKKIVIPKKKDKTVTETPKIIGEENVKAISMEPGKSKRLTHSSDEPAVMDTTSASAGDGATKPTGVIEKDNNITATVCVDVEAIKVEQDEDVDEDIEDTDEEDDYYEDDMDHCVTLSDDEDYIPTPVVRPKASLTSGSKSAKQNVTDKAFVKIKDKATSQPKLNLKQTELQRKVTEAEIIIEAGVILNLGYCRICDQNFDQEIQGHVQSTHGIDWPQYEKVVYVIEKHYQRRQVKQEATSDVKNIDLRELPLSKPSALKMLSQWRKSPPIDGSAPAERTDTSEGKAIIVNNVNFIQCGQCEKIFRRSSNLVSHMRHVHSKDTTAKAEAQKRRSTLSIPHSPGVQGKYHQFYTDNTSLCQTLGILGPDTEGKPSTACLLCRKLITGFNNRNRLVKHLTEKHLVDLNQYHKVISAATEESRQALILKILEDEKEQKIQKKRHRLGAEETEREYMQCPACFNFYSTPQNLLSHVRHLHKDDEHFSDLIKRVEAETSKLYKNHVQRPEELQVTCPYCKETRLGRSIIKHLNLTHIDEPNFKEALFKAEKEYSDLMRQRETKRKMKLELDLKMKGTLYPCKFCGREFTCRPTRHRHSKFNCEKNPDRAEAHWCSCGRRHSCRASLELHKAKCKIKRQPFQCHICGKVYQTRAGMYTHKRTTHMDHKESYKYHCDVCNKKFYQKHHFVRHSAIHTEDRKCQCELCGKQYKTPDAVRKHQMAVHYNKYPYYCTLCGHGMAKKQYLKAHKCGNVRRAQIKKSQGATREDKVKGEPETQTSEGRSDETQVEMLSAVQNIEQPPAEIITNIEHIEISQAALAEFSTSMPQPYTNVQESGLQKSGEGLAEPSILQVFSAPGEYHVIGDATAEPIATTTAAAAGISQGVSFKTESSEGTTMEVLYTQGVPMKYQYYNVLPSSYYSSAEYVATKDATTEENTQQ